MKYFLQSSQPSSLPGGNYYIKIIRRISTGRKGHVEICVSPTLPLRNCYYRVGAESLANDLDIFLKKAIEEEYILYCKIQHVKYIFKGRLSLKKKWTLLNKNIYDDSGNIKGQLRTVRDIISEYHGSDEDNDDNGYNEPPQIDWERETFYALGGEDYDSFSSNGGSIDNMMDSIGL